MTQWNPYFYDTPHPLNPIAPTYLPSIEGDDMSWDDGSQDSIPMRKMTKRLESPNVRQRWLRPAIRP
ncbi:hypothetical protein Bealeia1_02007 (plasmid) [Candidatus Bealeia paramacronuclearis]|uniref:Uncharacterized protein n=1 Tax=Candidatus Bealeia paramacronuclearis TaxID=1921001 RepID=A0ABZ2C760_9PROT